MGNLAGQANNNHSIKCHVNVSWLRGQHAAFGLAPHIHSFSLLNLSAEVLVAFFKCNQGGPGKMGGAVIWHVSGGAGMVEEFAEHSRGDSWGVTPTTLKALTKGIASTNKTQILPRFEQGGKTALLIKTPVGGRMLFPLCLYPPFSLVPALTETKLKNQTQSFPSVPSVQLLQASIFKKNVLQKSNREINKNIYM